MSGWIKLEKDLESDPRVLRMAKAIDKRFMLFGSEAALDPCNALALPGVTLVVGALARLWMYADSHARDDDSLDLSTDEIDELLGIPGFCSLMPEDWLTPLNDHSVELPHFQEHNNVEAKKRDLTQKRVERHRQKSKRSSVTPRNAPALPDQDQTKTYTKTQKSEERARESATGNGAEGNGRSAHTPDTFGLLTKLQAVYPAGTYTGVTWHQAERELSKLLDAGESPEQILTLTRAFAEQQQAKGSVGTEFVMSPKRFFAEGHWRGPFPLPAQASSPKRIRTATDIAEEFEARAAAAGAST